MNKLEELIKKLCPNGVEYKKTSEIKKESFWLMPSTPTYVADGIPYITSKNIKNGKINFEDVNYISKEDYASISSNRSIRKNDLLITMIGTIGETAFVEDNTEFYGQNMYLIRLNEKIVNRKFFNYYLTSDKVKSSLISRKNASSQGYIKAGSIENLLLPVPPLEVQCEIVHILDDFTLLSALLSAELKARRQQFSYYRECLINNGDHKIRLDKIVDIYLGLTHTPKYVTSGIKFISAQNTSKDYLDLTNVKYISREEYESITQNAKPKRGDILFTRVGSNLGHPVIVDTDEELCIFVSLGYLRVKDTSKVSNDYIKHWINTENFWNQVRKNVHGSAKVNLNTGWLSKFEISIPSFEEQKKIVNTLNILERLCNGITLGLPTEIEKRQKQYEYYRDELLSFKEAEEDV